MFGFSQNFWLSMLMLAFTGALIRKYGSSTRCFSNVNTCYMRGRVSSVNFIFIGSSNEIGGFESVWLPRHNPLCLLLAEGLFLLWLSSRLFLP